MTDRARSDRRAPPGTWRSLSAGLCGWAAAAIGISSPAMALALSCTAAALGAGLLLWTTLASRTSGQGAALSRVLAGLCVLPLAAITLISTQAHLGHLSRQTPALAAPAASGASIELEIVLSGYPEHRSTQFGVRGWVHGEVAVPAGRVPVLMWLEDPLDLPLHWGPGTRLSTDAVLEPLQPGDLAAYTVSPGPLVEDTASTSPLAFASATAAQLRAGLLDRASAVPGAELVPGFAVGDTSLVSTELEDAMLESSLSHLTAVSGSNTGLVIACVIWCFSRIGMGRRPRILIAALALAAFVVIVGPDASVQRAAIMAAVLLSGDFGGRRRGSIPGLGIAVLVLLGMNPWQALQAGFSLSVAATAGILLLAHPLTEWLRRHARLPHPLALPFAIALTAQAACSPLLLLLQPGIPIIGVVANVIAAPAAPLGTGLGLLAALLTPVSTPASEIITLAASFPARWVAATAGVCAAISAGRLHWPEGPAGALLLAACEAALLLAWALRTGRLGLPGGERVSAREAWQPRRPPPRAVTLVALSLCSSSLATLLGVTVAVPATTSASVPRDWVFVACDVGQGDAILARDPDEPDRTMLIDTGDDPEMLVACLEMFGVDRISVLVLSHDDRDHVGALPVIADRVDFALIAPTVRGENTEHREVVRTLRDAGIEFSIGGTGDTGRMSQHGLGWRILAPAEGASPGESNDASLIMLVEIDKITMLALGDTGYDQQKALLHDLGEVRVDVIKVAHHGSRDQDQSLPSIVRADWALVSVGAQNGYGHPAAETIAALTQSGTTALRTDKHGSIALRAAPNNALTPWLERVPPVGGDE